MHILRRLYRWCGGHPQGAHSDSVPRPSPPVIDVACTPTPSIPPSPKRYCRVAPCQHRGYIPPNAQWRSVIRCDHHDQRQIFIAFGATATEAVAHARQYVKAATYGGRTPTPSFAYPGYGVSCVTPPPKGGDKNHPGAPDGGRLRPPSGYPPKKPASEAVMQIQDIYTVLEQNHIAIDQTCPINHGTQLRLACGVKINHYTTNKVLVQGKAEPVAHIRGVLGLDAPSPRANIRATAPIAVESPTIASTPVASRARIDAEAARDGYITTPAMITAILDSIPAELRIPARPRHPEWSDNPNQAGLPF